MKWYSYLLCVICIISGIFCSMNLVKIWSEKSAIYGDVSSIETQNGYIEFAKFDFGVINFESDDSYVNYTFKQSFKHYDFNGLNRQYAVLFNDNLLSNVEYRAGEIICTFNMNFYNIDGVKEKDISLNILIDFYDEKTDVSFNLKNNDNCISYFNRYMIVNGAILKVVEKGV